MLRSRELPHWKGSALCNLEAAPSHTITSGMEQIRRTNECELTGARSLADRPHHGSIVALNFSSTRRQTIRVLLEIAPACLNLQYARASTARQQQTRSTQRADAALLAPRAKARTARPQGGQRRPPKTTQRARNKRRARTPPPRVESCPSSNTMGPP